jgi:hypothetical protein
MQVRIGNEMAVKMPEGWYWRVEWHDAKEHVSSDYYGPFRTEREAKREGPLTARKEGPL